MPDFGFYKDVNAALTIDSPDISGIAANGESASAAIRKLSSAEYDTSKTPYGGRTEYLTLKKILVRRPQETFKDQEQIHHRYKVNGWKEEPEYNACGAEVKRLISLLERYDVKVWKCPGERTNSLRNIFIRESVVVLDEGFVILSPTPYIIDDVSTVHPDPDIVPFLEQMWVPIVAKQEENQCASQIPSKRLEVRFSGLDMVWLTPQSVLLATSKDSTQEGAQHMKSIIQTSSKELQVAIVDVTSTGKNLRQLLSVVGRRKIVTRLDSISDELKRILLEQGGMEIIADIPQDEFDNFAADTLVLGQKKIIIRGNCPSLKAALAVKGFIIEEYSAPELLEKAGTSISALVVPIHRL